MTASTHHAIAAGRRAPEGSHPVLRLASSTYAFLVRERVTWREAMEGSTVVTALGSIALAVVTARRVRRHHRSASGLGTQA